MTHSTAHTRIECRFRRRNDMRRSGWLVLCAIVAFGFAVRAGEKPPESYVKNMKDTNAAAQELRKNLDAKDYDAIARNAATLKTLFANTQSFWEERKMEDAVGFA